LKLLSFQEGLKERERNISAFCELCSEYIVDKQFVYDGASFSFSIVPTSGDITKNVELSDLSSGEKQITSLFSHLYLSGNKRYFVLIDEPELSLSVPWQRRFLVDIHRADFCTGLVAVTHSPFVYENHLKKYAHSLGEFIVSQGQ
jgi:predicted ATPase